MKEEFMKIKWNRALTKLLKNKNRKLHIMKNNIRNWLKITVCSKKMLLISKIKKKSLR